ncbi:MULTISPECIES: glycosyltransferase family 4 protein [Anaerolinea]|uniref:glycosyltransferase family 4 protein n=1 Tax=Anaerolinea TaxID=233189 RepID=UPI0026031F96|nr:glycosyltransferase family 4 protein [Anaerolinea thermophila]
MKIIEVSNTFPPETFIQRHIQSLVEHGIFVHLVARSYDYSGSASLALPSLNLPASIMPNFNHLSLPDKIISTRWLTFRSIASPEKALSNKVILGFFDRLCPDLIHFHNAGLAASMAWIPDMLGVPYTISLRGSDVQVFPLQSVKQKEIFIQTLENATSIHSVCNALGNLVKEWYGVCKTIKTIYTTLPIPENLPEYSSSQPKGMYHFLSTGRMVWHKGFDQLIFALNRLQKTGFMAQLILAGDGPEMDHLLYLRKMMGLDSDIVFPGKLGYGDIQIHMRAAHAYIQSSIAEGLSNSLIEAVVNGVPVFATSVGGTREIIDDGVTGVLLPPFSPHLWPEKLILVQDFHLMERLRTAAYERAKLLFSAERHATEFASFYQEALSG